MTVELGTHTPQQLVKALARAGFVARFDDAAFIAATRVIPMRHERSSIPLDVVLAGPGLEQTFLDEVVKRQLRRRTIPYLALANLVVTKVLAGRPQDLVDVQELLAIQAARAPLARIRALLEAIEQALDEHDLLPRFESLVTASRASPSSLPRTRRRSKSRPP